MCAVLAKGHSFAVGEEVTDGKLNELVDLATISGIVNADVAAGAAIAFSKIAQANIDGSLLTGLANIVSGAGVIPVANLTSVAQKGANSDITSLSGLTTPLSVAQGGTGATAAANAASGVVVLDASAKLPAVDGSLLTGIITSYDSGWFAVTNGNSYTKTHSLGTTKVLALVYSATDNAGTNWMLECFQSGGQGITLLDLTTTQITAYAGNPFNYMAGGPSPHNTGVNSGYARIIMLALG